MRAWELAQLITVVCQGADGLWQGQLVEGGMLWRGEQKEQRSGSRLALLRSFYALQKLCCC